MDEKSNRRVDGDAIMNLIMSLFLIFHKNLKKTIKFKEALNKTHDFINTPQVESGWSKK